MAALAANLAADPAGPIDTAQAECLAPTMVDLLGGPAVFESAGISPDDLASADAGVLVATGIAPDVGIAGDLGAAAVGCGFDLAGAVAQVMGDDLSSAARGCLAEGFSADLIGGLLLDVPETGESVIDITLACAHLLD